MAQMSKIEKSISESFAEKEHSITGLKCRFPE